ncbi:MAG: hypothetical protein IH591_14305 [Bacteroidales bacterium]|nr:hypothetical protein [Bacteroidales bacterium]
MIRITTIITILILLAVSCEMVPLQRFGFDSQYGETSTGLTVFTVSQSTDQVFLTGSIVVTEGKLKTELITPGGEIVYYDTVFAPDTLKIGRTFTAEPGVWKLKYTSLEGTGIITLHAILLDQ